MSKTKVVNVKVANIRPEYDNLEEWMNDPNNVYIGRRGIVFIDKVRYPKQDSIWCNPFKIDKTHTREQVIQQYKEYIVEKIKTDELQDELMELNGRNLGCWCKPEPCHGDVLVRLINAEAKRRKNDIKR